MSEKSSLYKFFWDCGRSGEVEGLFIAKDADVEAAIGKEIYFGGILGKHSEVFGPLEEGDVERIDVPHETVDILRQHLGEHISGYNPLVYISDEEDE